MSSFTSEYFNENELSQDILAGSLKYFGEEIRWNWDAAKELSDIAKKKILEATGADFVEAVSYRETEALCIVSHLYYGFPDPAEFKFVALSRGGIDEHSEIQVIAEFYFDRDEWDVNKWGTIN